MRIAFIHQGRSLLPEIVAYTRFFESKGHQTCVCINAEPAPFVPDIEWHFMGFGGARKWENTVLIHEYASSSVPPFINVKNACKRILNPTPDFRIYLNEWVRSSFRFADNLPFGFRDMGVWVVDYKAPTTSEKIYDFIYPGSIHPYSYFRQVLLHFRDGSLKNHSILVLSKTSDKQRGEWNDCKNIHFKDPVSNAELRSALLASRFGLNCRPSGRPYDFQTSSKLLEYAAARMPVVTTGSPWLTEFCKRHGGNYYLLAPDLSNFDPVQFEKFHYEHPDVTGYDWEQQILGSGVYQFLQAGRH